MPSLSVKLKSTGADSCTGPTYEGQLASQVGADLLALSLAFETALSETSASLAGQPRVADNQQFRPVTTNRCSRGDMA